MTFDVKWAKGKFPHLKDAEEKLNAKRTALAAIFNEAGSELDPKKVTSVQVADGTALREVISAYNDELETLQTSLGEHMDTARAAYNALHPDTAVPGVAEGGDGASMASLAREVKSVGELFVASKAFADYKPGSGVGPIATLDIEPRQILNTLFETGAGWDPEATRTGRVELLATRPAPMVIDAIPQTTTNQKAIVYMEETTFTNAAAEADEGGTYGEATLVLTEKTSNVRKVAVWLPVTDEQFDDEPRSRDYVNNRLVFMLRQRLDLQALVGSGAGTPTQLLGTESVTGIQTQALGTDPFFDAVYKAFRKIKDNGFAEPSVFFIRPDKWESARLSRTSDGIYILGNPQDASPVRLFGVPGIETTAAPATKLLTGDYRNFAELASRRGVDVQVTNAHSTFFIEGKLAIRADVRVALVHYRPKAFAEVTGL